MQVLHRGATRRLAWLALASGGVAAFAVQPSRAEAPSSPTTVLPDRPLYTAAEVKKRGRSGDAVWVTYGSGVYDISEFVEGHPGGDQILEAAGGPVEPFWALYAQHDQDFVRELLEEYRIGDLSDAPSAAVGADPYVHEPPRPELLIARSAKPFNAEPPLPHLVSQITPNESFYVRNHLPVPVVDAQSYRLRVVDEDGSELASLTLDELKRLPKYEVAATLQCAGNRRDEMRSVRAVRGGSWGGGAIGNAVWGGARLVDVVGDSKLASVAHVCFEGLDRDPGNGAAYGASVPAGKGSKDLGLAGDVLLAYEMNGEELPGHHGFPVRAVAPGVVGARSVKWLSTVRLSPVESDSHWQQRDYKAFSPDVDWHNITDADWDRAESIQEAPVVSAVCDVQVDKTSKSARVRGYAWSGGGRGILRVDVSGDGGATWSAAQLHDKPQVRNAVFDWTQWAAVVQVGQGEDAEIVCKAVDSAHNTQPESLGAIWNLRGLLNNAWHRVKVDDY